MTSGPSEEGTFPAAARWFGLRVVYQEATPAWTAFAMLKTTLMLFVTIGLSLLFYEPKRFCDVVLYRLDDGSEVWRCEYDDSEGATEHVISLKGRLLETHVFDLCRELGLSVSEVVGAGRPAPSSPDEVAVDWLAVSGSRRYP